MRVLFTAIRALIYGAGFVVVWGYVGLWARRFDAGLGGPFDAWVRPIGIGLMVLGCLGAIACVATFVVRGAGTPAPFDPPRRFVAVGPYRYVRNPMYIAGFLVMIGFALLQSSPAILIVAAAMLGSAHLFVVWYEEPTLEHSFGEAYRAYRGAVHRWVPRVPPP
jgi:protein-S-isoprenylcysteine O-methyltransferase Ste14